MLIVAACGDDAPGSDPATGGASSGGAGASGAGEAGGGDGGSGGAPGDEYGIHLVHAAMTADAVQLCIDGVAVGGLIAAGNASVLGGAAAGTHSVGVASNADCSVALAADVTVELTGASPRVAVVLYGDGSPAHALLLSANRVEEPIFGGMAWRFFHAAPGSGALDLWVDNRGDPRPRFLDAPYGGEGLITPIGTPGYVGESDVDDVLYLRDAATDAILLTTIPIVLAGEQTYTVLAVGAPSELRLLSCVDYPVPSCAPID